MWPRDARAQKRKTSGPSSPEVGWAEPVASIRTADALFGGQLPLCTQAPNGDDSGQETLNRNSQASVYNGWLSAPNSI